MADPIAMITRVSPPATGYAQLTNIAGASSPAENFLVWAFSGVDTEFLDFHGVLSSDYSGRGLLVDLKTSCGDNTGGEQTRWEAAFRREADDAEDLDTTVYDYDAAKQGVSVDLPSAVGELSYDSIVFANGAEIDSLVAGESFVLRVWRDHDHADDDPTEDAYIHYLTIRER